MELDRSFFVERISVESQLQFIKDKDCTKDTPVIYGKPDNPIYGTGKKINPRVPGRTDTQHQQKIYLSELLPLEEYDQIIVLLSGGKDSIASYLKLQELGVPKEKIEFWHHDIDGGNPIRRMDWRCTRNYVSAFAKAEKIPLRLSWRVNGFFGELYRIGASEPIEWMEPDTGEIMQCRLSSNFLSCKKVKETASAQMEEELKRFGYRMKFPAKTGDLSRRWCSAYLKIMVADSVMSNLSRLNMLKKSINSQHSHYLTRKSRNSWRQSCQKRQPLIQSIVKQNTYRGKLRRDGFNTMIVPDGAAHNSHLSKENVKLLIVSGERRGESAGRSHYNEIEIHRTNAICRAHRMVHQWRPVIDYSEKDVWTVLKRHKINPHPCYRAGWNRCSCAACIFSTPALFAGYRELYPKEFKQLVKDEQILGFTLDNNSDLETFIGDTKSCLCRTDAKAIESLITGEFNEEDIYVSETWKYPAGAFHGAAGGPC